ncbi:hypothetical protein [Collimonas fungivorans]|uniref:Uncharacterized protein n=1 Tax=Collimonas fungivorans (strain Ter331) TaxID=1005048 RepID=G0AEY9_COLFT|nr:hypothetical protein [Collimonas fungivorans]AEK60516.1 hypothetical protein CFU_0681 [Collimonas fungivorans Ter331]
MVNYSRMTGAAGLLALLLTGCGNGDSLTPATAPSLDLPPSQIPPTTPTSTTPPVTQPDVPSVTPPAAVPPVTPSVAPPPVPPPIVPPVTPPVVAVAYANCMDSTVAGSYEEQRLPNILQRGDTQSFSDQILSASAFDGFGPQFAKQLCQDGAVKTFSDAIKIVKTAGDTVWQAAVDRVQGRKISGSLPQSDDRMLYWARLHMTLALRQWLPQIPLTLHQRSQLQWLLEKSSRGQYAIQFPSGKNIKRIIISGFDPFTLGTPGANYPSTNIRIGNPSGAIALALNGKQIALPDGSTAVIQTYLLPVNYAPFREGMQEHTLAPFFTGPEHVLASISMSQGEAGVFNIENWNGRYHATAFADNLGVVIPYGLTPSMQDADIYPPEDMLGYNPQPWVKEKPAQYTLTSLPIDKIMAANTGTGVINAANAATGGYTMVWHTQYAYFADCSKFITSSFTSNYTAYPPATPPAAPPASACAYKGGGSNYLSNESAYRNTLLRDTLNPSIAAGHLHVPIMTNFDDNDDGKITDAKFESYRDSIVQQTTSIVAALAKSLL